MRPWQKHQEPWARSQWPLLCRKVCHRREGGVGHCTLPHPTRFGTGSSPQPCPCQPTWLVFHIQEWDVVVQVRQGPGAGAVCSCRGSKQPVRDVQGALLRALPTAAAAEETTCASVSAWERFALAKQLWLRSASKDGSQGPIACDPTGAQGRLQVCRKGVQFPLVICQEGWSWGTEFLSTWD